MAYCFPGFWLLVCPYLQRKAQPDPPAASLTGKQGDSLKRLVELTSTIEVVTILRALPALRAPHLDVPSLVVGVKDRGVHRPRVCARARRARERLWRRSC